MTTRELMVMLEKTLQEYAHDEERYMRSVRDPNLQGFLEGRVRTFQQVSGFIRDRLDIASDRPKEGEK